MENEQVHEPLSGVTSHSCCHPPFLVKTLVMKSGTLHGILVSLVTSLLFLHCPGVQKVKIRNGGTFYSVSEPERLVSVKRTDGIVRQDDFEMVSKCWFAMYTS